MPESIVPAAGSCFARPSHAAGAVNGEVAVASTGIQEVGDLFWEIPSHITIEWQINAGWETVVTGSGYAFSTGETRALRVTANVEGDGIVFVQFQRQGGRPRNDSARVTKSSRLKDYKMPVVEVKDTIEVSTMGLDPNQAV